MNNKSKDKNERSKKFRILGKALAVTIELHTE